MHIGIVSLFSCKLLDPTLDLRHGGAEVQIITTAKELAKLGHQVTIYVFDLGQEIMTVDGLRVVPTIRHRPEVGPLLTILEQRKLWKALRSTQSSHILMPGGTGILWLLNLYGKRYNAKVISVLMHDRDVIGAPLLKGIDKAGFKSALTKCAGIIAQNKAQRDSVDHLDLPSITIPPPITLVENNTRYKKYITWVGRCVEWKQPELFLQLAREYPEHQFLMILAKQDEVLFETLSSKAKAISNLSIKVDCTNQEVLISLAKSQVMVSSSISEGFPTIFLEAFSQKCAVLSLNSNPDALFEKSKAGQCFHNDWNQLSESLHTLLADASLLQSMQEAGYEYVCAHHRAEVIGKCYEEFMATIN